MDVVGEGAAGVVGSDVVCANECEAYVALAGATAVVAVCDVVVSTDDGPSSSGHVAY